MANTAEKATSMVILFGYHTPTKRKCDICHHALITFPQSNADEEAAAWDWIKDMMRETKDFMLLLSWDQKCESGEGGKTSRQPINFTMANRRPEEPGITRVRHPSEKGNNWEALFTDSDMAFNELMEEINRLVCWRG